MTITVTITNPRHLAAINAAYLSATPMPIPVRQGSDPVSYSSAADFAQQNINYLCDYWAESTGVDRISVAAFVRRFPGAVMDAVVASTDPTVIAILAQLDAVTHVRLGAQTTIQGIGYLVAAGYLTQPQAEAVLAY